MTITIDGTEHELAPDCLRNWQDVVCTTSRKDLNGVTRSFTSKFEFTGDAYDLLLDLYLLKETSAKAEVAVWGLCDDWTYSRIFGCPLDFSTVEIEDYIFSINAIDDSLSALISSNKSTKYEFSVNVDIIPDGTFRFDRLPMSEYVTYGFTQGDSLEDGSIDVSISKSDGDVIWMGSTESEVVVGGSVYWKDDQENDSSGYMIAAIQPVTLRLDYKVAYDSSVESPARKTVEIQIVTPAGGVNTVTTICDIGAQECYKVTDESGGDFASLSALLEDYPEFVGQDGDDRINHQYAVINGEVWKRWYDGVNTVWTNTHESEEQYVSRTAQGSKDIYVPARHKVRAAVRWQDSDASTARARIISSSLKFSWTSRGEACNIPAFTPERIADALLARISDGSVNAVSVVEAGEGSPLGKLMLVAAESVRGIGGAKLYTSFSDLTTSLEAVFGYVPVVEEPADSPIRQTVIPQAYGFYDTLMPTSSFDAPDPSGYTSDNVYYNTAARKFMLHKSGFWYTFPGSDQWNDPATGGAYTDRLYRIDGRLWYFPASDSLPREYLYPVARRFGKWQRVRFVSRESLFDTTRGAVEITGVTDLLYSVDYSRIYSHVEVGYEAKDYDSVNGRDEFNFSQTYSIGGVNGDQKLSLVSRYRADSYGLEFAAQSRAEETTDTKADNDVFMVVCDKSEGVCVPERSAVVEGTLSDQVFNARISPRHCALANRVLIAAQAQPLTLAFASATGNSAVRVDGERIDSDITFDSRAFTVAEVEFQTDYLGEVDSDTPVTVKGRGLTFTGFVKEMEDMFAYQAPRKFTLLVTNIEKT